MNSLKLPLWMNGLNGSAGSAYLDYSDAGYDGVAIASIYSRRFFSFNIAIAIIVLLTSLYSEAAGLHGVPNSAAGQHYAAFIAQRRVYPRGVD
jgi:hypothetical protein